MRRRAHPRPAARTLARPVTVQFPACRVSTASPTALRCEAEASAPMRTSSRAGSPTTIFANRDCDRLATAYRCAARHDRATDRGALLPRLGGHLARHLTRVEIKLLIVGCHVGREDRAVERISLGIERDAVLEQVRMARSFCAVAAEPVRVTTSQPSSRSSRSPRPPMTSCSASGGECRFLDAPYQRLGKITRGGRGLHEAGHAGEKARREFLEQAPRLGN